MVVSFPILVIEECSNVTWPDQAGIVRVHIKWPKASIMEEGGRPRGQGGREQPRTGIVIVAVKKPFESLIVACGADLVLRADGQSLCAPGAD